MRDRQTTMVEGLEGHSNITAFPSNYDGSVLFLAVNDDYDPDTQVVASMLLSRSGLRDLIYELSAQLIYMEEQADAKTHAFPPT